MSGPYREPAEQGDEVVHTHTVTLADALGLVIGELRREVRNMDHFACRDQERNSAEFDLSGRERERYLRRIRAARLRDYEKREALRVLEAHFVKIMREEKNDDEK